MKRTFVCAVIFFAMITTIEMSPAQIADQFLFTKEARARLELVPQADTLRRIKLLNNIAFSKRNEDYKQARQEAQLLIEAFRVGHDEPIVDAYHWSLRVMEIREWGKIHKAWSGAKGLIKQALDSLTVIRNREPNNKNIRFLRANVAIEAAKFIPELLVEAREDLEYLDQKLDKSNSGAQFFLELDWAKYFYWMAEKEGKQTQQRFLLSAQFHINEAMHYAECQFYHEEIVRWHKRIQKKKPDTTIWSKEVLKLVRYND